MQGGNNSLTVTAAQKGPSQQNLLKTVYEDYNNFNNNTLFYTSCLPKYLGAALL